MAQGEGPVFLLPRRHKKMTLSIPSLSDSAMVPLHGFLLTRAGASLSPPQRSAKCSAMNMLTHTHSLSYYPTPKDQNCLWILFSSLAPEWHYGKPACSLSSATLMGRSCGAHITATGHIQEQQRRPILGVHRVPASSVGWRQYMLTILRKAQDHMSLQQASHFVLAYHKPETFNVQRKGDFSPRDVVIVAFLFVRPLLYFHPCNTAVSHCDVYTLHSCVVLHSHFP